MGYLSLTNNIRIKFHHLLLIKTKVKHQYKKDQLLASQTLKSSNRISLMSNSLINYEPTTTVKLLRV